MLVDVELASPDFTLAAILSAISGGDHRSLRVSRGVYLSRHWNFYNEVATPLVDEFAVDFDPDYGVCDSPDQFLAGPGAALDADLGRRYCISFVEVRRDEQPPDGGWRWHKWGPYIGEKTPTTEYLHDEPDIDRVFTFHVYEVTTP